MTLQEIKTALDDGNQVAWGNSGYEVIKDCIGQYLIHCLWNDHYIGLTHRDGITMNGDESQFFLCNSFYPLGE